MDLATLALARADDSRAVDNIDPQFVTPVTPIETDELRQPKKQLRTAEAEIER